ncbi:MAG TPA: MerR family transcriptional regulator [Victivallales bacterium]|nr:MerR family transcriptional regulator [Victivallales bacterium]HRR28347.1 MerR family transcriptional regulator [Victivallales bacterium]
MGEKYTVIELSEKMQVPRTTITDWLTRYANFIDYKMQGKRKVYTDKSVEVLSEIKELRDKGLSSFDIEEELAKRHPIHGELSSIPNSDQSSPDKNSNNTLQDQVNQTTDVVRQNANSEMAEMLRNMLIEMSKRMDELEKQNRVNIERSVRWNMISFLVVLILAIVAIISFLLIKNITEEKESIDKEKQQYIFKLDSLNSDLKNTKLEKQKIEEKIIEIERDRQLYKGELENLQQEINKQKEEFENVLKNAIRDTEKSKEAEILQLRDKFAEERLNFLKEIEKIKEDKKALEIMIAKFNAKTEEQKNAIDKLSGEDKDGDLSPSKEK